MRVAAFPDSHAVVRCCLRFCVTVAQTAASTVGDDAALKLVPHCISPTLIDALSMYLILPRFSLFFCVFCDLFVFLCTSAALLS